MGRMKTLRRCVYDHRCCISLCMWRGLDWVFGAIPGLRYHSTVYIWLRLMSAGAELLFGNGSMKRFSPSRVPFDETLL
jgi:hypothetical protein